MSYIQNIKHFKEVAKDLSNFLNCLLPEEEIYDYLKENFIQRDSNIFVKTEGCYIEIFYEEEEDRDSVRRAGVLVKVNGKSFEEREEILDSELKEEKDRLEEADKKYRDLDKRYRDAEKELKEVRGALYKVSKDLQLNQQNKNNLVGCLQNIINSSDWGVDKIKEQCSSYLESFGKYINPDNKMKTFKELNEKFGCKSFGGL